MLQKIRKKTLMKSLQLLCVLSAALLVWGCGGGGGGGSESYDTPSTAGDNAPVGGAATSVLIEPATLKGWIDDGLVGNESGFGDKVVIIEFRSSDALRIAGACRLEGGDLTGPRFEGVGDATPLVATGAQMDAVIQRLGIDEDTIIVFTSDGSAYMPTRAYWTFRYWGFPKDRVKLLNGGNDAFAAAYPELMTDVVPSPTPSTYSVRNLAGLNDDLRASVSEMIEIVKGLSTSTTDIIFDARGDSYYNGTNATSGLLVSGTKVVMDGHPVGGQYLSQAELFTDGKYKTAEEIEALFVAKGWDSSKKTTVYCTSGYSATPLFFALDAILDVDVQLFDGSWSQLGKYSDNAAADGELPTDSPWAIDDNMEVVTYNKFEYTTPLLIETLNATDSVGVLSAPEDAVAPQAAPFSGDNPLGDDDVVQSQVEAADAAYGSGAVLIPAANLTATPNVLIEKEYLQAWMDQGLLAVAPGAGERVVVLDVTSSPSYNSAHIENALLWNTSGQAKFRMEGPAPAINMVLDGADMDARIQALGIDEDTTIVLTSSAGNKSYFPSRAYFTFRYWGWPKDRIKVLNGYNTAWSDLKTIAENDPTPTASTLSVADLAYGAQLDTRVALAELMDAVRDERGTAIDFRGDKSAVGSTPGVYSDVAGDFGVFEGTLKGGTSYSYAAFQVDGSDRFKSATLIEQEMLDAGIDISTFSTGGSYINPVYSYCRTAYIASTGFFVLDAILDVDVMVYDGSWSQWGKMSTVTTAKGGELADASLWATDNATYMDVINYNVDSPTYVIEPLNPDAAALLLDPADAAANQVEGADDDYQIQAPAADSGTDGSTPPTSDGGGGSVPGGSC